ncbi:protein of unknown function [Taphrina deformans PYCC 5710]|uniref:TFIIS central domain-containing protein n=1 Tax=Taphrina deformans (strain PYCC 5710 / ATCC 11124 / CBS 356.35 / IMI 108563 / JCM 9778 / NBRC 8474) TaxID=1097556 RepID=R4X793_TAPDE|nr:protein of unknown function [Taphrina deformans PYCC 5710]|eukprot:CCG81166.1 protein of unknown function [Taphrina deformans PYCC 5710]
MSRDNCIKAIDKALTTDSSSSSSSGSDTAGLASAIAHSIQEKHGADETGYRNEVRAKVSNIRRNPDLRHAIVHGTLPPDQVTLLTADDMATPAKRAENAAIRAHGRDAVRLVSTLEPNAPANDLEPGVVRNTGQEGIEYDAP